MRRWRDEHPAAFERLLASVRKRAEAINLEQKFGGIEPSPAVRRVVERINRRVALLVKSWKQVDSLKHEAKLTGQTF